MPFVGTVLEISRRGEESAHFEWRIEGWNEVFKQNFIGCPLFSFAGSLWSLMVEPYTSDSNHTLRISLFCSAASRGIVCNWIGVRTEDGTEDGIGSCTVKPEDERVLPSWILLDLRQLKKRWAPSGTLTFLVRMRTGPDTEKEKKLEEEVASYKQQLEESAKSYAKLKEQTLELDTLVLQEHLKKLLLSSDDHDVVLRVKTKEFRAHKNVLRARSPVFEAMFKHGMKESSENSVDIEDCDPDSFGQFLQYIYTGQMDDLSPSNASCLYFAGDKYELPGLKRRCVDFLKSSLSTTSVSDVITLAVTHEEEQLLENAMVYVTQHLEKIMETVEWQRFAVSNPIRANEVCLKALKRRQSPVLQD